MQRVFRGQPATVSLTLDESATPESATVTATRGDGSPFTIAATPTVAANVVSVDLSATETAQLDLLSLAYAVSDGGSVATYRQRVEIAGAPFVTLAQLKAEPGLEAATDDRLAAALVAVEDELENAAHVAFVPRYARAELNGNGTTDLLLPRPEVSAVRSVEIDGTELTVDELAEIVVDRDAGVLYRPSRWPAGRYNVVVEYEHGFDFPPGRVPFAARQLVAYLLIESPVDPRAISVSNPEGVSQTFVQAAVRGAIFAMPEANAVVQQYGYREVA